MEVVVNGKVQVIEVGTDTYQIAVNQQPVQVLAVGVQGPAGPTGQPGPPGPSGGTTFIYHQNAPATTWNIQHNLGQYPSVTVVDSAGSAIIGDVKYLDQNNVVLNFVSGFGGVAYLNV